MSAASAARIPTSAPAARSMEGAGSMESGAHPLTLSLPADLVEAVAQRAAQLVADRLAAADDAWLDVEGAARYLACKPRRIYDLHSQRRIPAHKDGSRLLFRRSELDAYVKGCS